MTSPHMAIPTQKGTYILHMHLPTHAHLVIGRLGAYDFAEGWYLYVGSAFGTGGLRGRLKHHLAPVTRPHWHVDYLRQVAPVYVVWCLASETIYEHAWAQVLRNMDGGHVPVSRFGASDCRCETHLVSFSFPPDLTLFCQQAGVTLQRYAVTS